MDRPVDWMLGVGVGDSFGEVSRAKAAECCAETMVQ